MRSRLHRQLSLLSVAVLLALSACSNTNSSTEAMPPATNTAADGTSASVDIAFDEFTLPNGLRVVVHEDRKAPVVAVNIWYHVGSKDEQPGKTGFAHLFEHLMFQGSENHQNEFFIPFEQVGTTDQNGTTNTDRTNYFQNVPTTALDMALWMESDRMGHLLGAIDQKLLDEQRGVVQNEKRQGENQPYGLSWDHLFKASYPKGHPYSWTTIGSMADLNAASLEDVKTWFRTWYGPNNAVLVLAGDIDVETARAKVTRYFGDIPAGPSMTQPAVNIAQRSESTREVLEDRVPQTRILRAWNVVDFNHDDATELQLLAQVLGGSRSSRLDRRLVHEEKLADNVAAFAMSNQLGGQFILMVDVKEGVDPAKVEVILAEEVGKLIQQGPTAEELAQAKTVFEAGFVRGIERVGGFGGKSDVLAECAVFAGDAGCFRKGLQDLQVATPEALKRVAASWLAKGDHTLLIQPGDRPDPTPDIRSTSDEVSTVVQIPVPNPEYTTVSSDVDRSQGVPKTEKFPDLSFPALQRGKLGNGIQIVLAERHDVPVVQLSMEFDGGFRLDQGRPLGTASFTMGMLDEGAGDYDALAFGDAAEKLGANIGAGASLDGSNVYLSALTDHLDASIGLWADVIQRPRFADADIERVRQTTLAGIKQEKSRPNSLALRLLPPLLYGEGHPYAIPFSGSGSEASISSLTRDDLLTFHRDQIRPELATVIVVGDTTLAEITPLLDKHFAQWKAQGDSPAIPQPAEVAKPTAAQMYLVDQPGAIQANIFIGQLVPSTKSPDALVFDIANSVLGGEFSSRLNMNLREDKSWSYGSYSFTQGALGQRPWLVMAPVQIDRTLDAVRELQRELTEYTDGSRPANADEVQKIVNNNVRGLPGSYETARSVMASIGGILRFGRPDDYPVQYKALQESVTVDQVQSASKTLDPSAMTWVIVGDLAKIEQPLRELMGDKVSVLDSDGKPVR